MKILLNLLMLPDPISFCKSYRNNLSHATKTLIESNDRFENSDQTVTLAHLSVHVTRTSHIISNGV
jgi:hypothetical protein